jgi:hypothetical protein
MLMICRQGGPADAGTWARHRFSGEGDCTSFSRPNPAAIIAGAKSTFSVRARRSRTGSNSWNVEPLAAARPTEARTRNRSTSAPLAEPHCPIGLDKRCAPAPVRLRRHHDAPHHEGAS